MSTPARRLGSLLISGVVLAGAGFGFYQLWTDRVEQTLAQSRQSLQTMAAGVDATAHGALTSLRILRTGAERELQRSDSAPPVSAMAILEARPGGFVTTGLPPEYPARLGAYLFGKGGLPEAGTDRAREMAAALALTPLMADVRESVAEASWIYYTSAQGFTSLYPYKGAEMAERLKWSDTFLTHPLFASMGPQRNPGHQIRWQDAYPDQAGQGLMTSLVAPVYDELGRFRGIVALDFTLTTLERYLRGQRTSQGTLYIVNRSGQVLASSGGISGRRVQMLSELLPPEFAGQAEALLSHPSGECLKREGWLACGRDLQEAPWRVLCIADGRELGLQVLGEMRVEAAGLVLLLLLLVAVERRRRLAEAMRDGDARYRRIIEGSDQGFWEWNIPARQFSASSRFDAILGYSPDDSPLRQRQWPQHIHPDDLPRMRASMRRHLKGKIPFHRLEFRAKSRAGKWRWLLTQGRVVERDARGRAIMMSGTLTDITERRQAESDLLAAKQAAEAANVAKSRFLAAASHDLRQPLQASNLFISALGRTPLNEDQKKIAHNLGLATKALGELLDALLDISKLDAGVVTPQLAPVEIYEIFQRIESEFASLALEKDLRFKLFFPSRPLIFETDLGLLMGLLRNLVGNAIRYTEWGGVLVGTRMRRGQLVIQVWDTGIGIREDQLPRIYDEFYQVDNPQRDRGRGLGLGLSIVRRMADLLGYGLSCQSRYGRGTAFEISIPLVSGQRLEPARLEAAAPRQEDFGVLKGCLCVLVEDDPLVAGALEAWLGSHDISLRYFPDGESALADPVIARADFFVTDFRMPGELNGIELLNTVRRQLGRPIRAVIVTGDTSREQIDAFAAAGWPVLHKPIPPHRLLEIMVRLWREIPPV